MGIKSKYQQLCTPQNSYCFTLVEEQLEYHAARSTRLTAWNVLSLVELAERETKLVQISRFKVEILPGQVMVDNTQLAKLWIKTARRFPNL
jgi:hypothetical protein